MDPEKAKYIFTVLTVAGFGMLVLETFLPGGVLGVLGALALVGSMIVAFPAFEPYGAVVALAILIAGTVFMLYWLKIAPKTWLGRKLTIDADLSESKGTDSSLEHYIGKHGVTACQLRPSGFAVIEKHRVDVVTRGEMIDEDQKIKVIAVESNRVVVKKI